MKLVTQNYRSGDLAVVEVPAPALPARGILVRNHASVVSVGTEKLIMELAQKSLLGKARARPDLVKQVIDKARTDGIVETYRAVVGRLEKSLPLGYSCAGVVEEADTLSGLRAGDAVACFGSGFASHAEFVAIPGRLYARVPDGLALDQAAFAGVGAIALHSVRKGRVGPGSTVAVIGLGLLGQIATQILLASGCKVFGIDIVQDRVERAIKMGAQGGASVDDPNLRDRVRDLSNGHGAEVVLVFASAEDTAPVKLAAEIAGDGGRLVVPGMVDLELPRREFYDKELELVVPRSAGPGIYDSEYELRGADYPAAQVRWTAQRNMEHFLEMQASGAVNVSQITTHSFPIGEAEDAYRLLGERGTDAIGVVLTYPDQAPVERSIRLREPVRSDSKSQTVRVGLIGAGLWARSTLLPIMKKLGDVELKGLATATGNSASDSGGKYGFEYAGTDYAQILSDDGIDAVVIATRHDLHAQIAIEALQAGKHVFVEKPPALTTDQLTEVLKAAQASDRIFMAGFNRRFAPYSIAARDLLGGAAPLMINIGVNAGAVPEESWVHDPEVGGGRIIGEMCHFVDLAQFLASSAASNVFARGFATGSSPPDNAVATISMANGSVATISYSALGDKSAARERVEIVGDGVVCTIDDFKSMSFVKSGKTQKQRKRLGVDRGHKNELFAFFSAILTGAESPLPLMDIASAMSGTFSIVESMTAGTPIDVITPIPDGGAV